MEIRQKFTVDQDIATVWEALKDIRLVAACMPGAELERVSDDQTEVEGRVRVKLGPIGGAFGGRGKITRDDAARTGSLEGTGADRGSGSRVQIRLDYTLSQASSGSGTDVSLEANVALSGPLAQFSKGPLIHEAAAQLTRQFAQNLQRRLLQTAHTERDAGAADASAPIPHDEPAGELSLLTLIYATLKARLCRILGLGRSRA